MNTPSETRPQAAPIRRLATALSDFFGSPAALLAFIASLAVAVTVAFYSLYDHDTKVMEALSVQQRRACSQIGLAYLGADPAMRTRVYCGDSKSRRVESTLILDANAP